MGWPAGSSTRGCWRAGGGRRDSLGLFAPGVHDSLQRGSVCLRPAAYGNATTKLAGPCLHRPRTARDREPRGIRRLLSGRRSLPDVSTPMVRFPQTCVPCTRWGARCCIRCLQVTDGHRMGRTTGPTRPAGVASCRSAEPAAQRVAPGHRGPADRPEERSRGRAGTLLGPRSRGLCPLHDRPHRGRGGCEGRSRAGRGHQRQRDQERCGLVIPSGAESLVSERVCSQITS